MTEFCKRCVISTNRPIASREYSRTPGSEPGRMAFFDGVCGACRVHEAKQKTDWGEREQALRDLLARYRRSDGRPDVLVPGSGGKDSVMAAALLRDRYGMHPLTVTWAPHEYTEVGRRNFYRWLEMGFDNILVTPNPRVHRKLTQLAFLNLLNPFQPFILGQRNCATLASNFGIDLVFYGEDDADYEGEAGWQEKSEVLDGSPGSRIIVGAREYYIGGVSFSDLIATHGLTAHDLKIYQPKPPGAAVHALGRYLRWDPEEAYYYAVDACGFEANEERTPGTFTKFSSIDDRLDPLHYHTMWRKFGVGRASHDASMEIRHGRLTREEGVALVRRYDGTEMSTPGYAEWCCAYMQVSPETFWETLDKFTRKFPVVE